MNKRVIFALSKRGRTLRSTCVSVLLITTLHTAGVSAQDRQSQPSSSDGSITRQQADDILDELRKIRQLLEAQAKPGVRPQQPVPLTGKMHLGSSEFSLGSNDAPVTIVEFADYQCPYCRVFQDSTFIELRKKFIDTGKVRFVIEDLPLNGHPDAMIAAEATRCAADQGSFWPMHDSLYRNPSKLSREDLIRQADALKLDKEQFRSCLEDQKHRAEIQNEIRLATSLNVEGTPSFLIGKSTGGEVSGVLVSGVLPLSAFEERISQAEISR